MFYHCENLRCEKKKRKGQKKRQKGTEKANNKRRFSKIRRQVTPLTGPGQGRVRQGRHAHIRKSRSASDWDPADGDQPGGLTAACGRSVWAGSPRGLGVAATWTGLEAHVPLRQPRANRCHRLRAPAALTGRAWGRTSSQRSQPPKGYL